MLFERKKMGRPTNRPDTNTLAELYNSCTITEIAEKYNVKPATVRYWISQERKKELQKGIENNG